MKKIIVPLLFAVLGCGGPPHRASEKDPERVATVDSTVLVVLDDTLRFQLELIGHREEVLPDGRLRAKLQFVNHSARDLHMQLAWTFKDNQGFAVEPDSPFEHLLIGGGQTKELTRDSLAPGATRFHVQARTAVSAER